jgi:hypothetical protein
LRTAIGLLTLGIVGGIGPVGFSAMPYFTPVLVGTIAAFFALLALGVLASALRHGLVPRFVPKTSRPARRRPVAVAGSAGHGAT